MSSTHRCGLVTLIGRPNVGKSTLLNRLVGSKISITSSRPQTTRYRLLGIKTTPDAQIVYVDTPGLRPHDKGLLDRHLNRVASTSLEGVDCLVLLISADGWNDADDYPLSLVSQQNIPVILVINKIDRLKDRRKLLPLIQTISRKAEFTEIFPVSARSGTGVVELETAILKYLPAQPPLYPADQLSDRSDRFLAAELVREQVFRGFGQEVPYATAVQIDLFKRNKATLNIEATLWVEKEGQKAILIGKQGARMKITGTRARLAMEKLFDTKVHLKLWVKVRAGWLENERALQSLGYSEKD